ncbi:hypothetical protein CF326_g6866, partial [Tilletia indica]
MLTAGDEPLPRASGVQGPRPAPGPPPAPQTPVGSKRPAGEALSASPINRKKILGGVAARLGVNTETLDRAWAEAEVDAVDGEDWSAIMDDEDEVAQLAALSCSPADKTGEPDQANTSTPARTANKELPRTGDLSMAEAEEEEREGWQLAQPRSQRRQSSRIAAAATVAATAAATRNEDIAQPTSTHAAGRPSRTLATSIHAPANRGDVAVAAIAAATQELRDADKNHQAISRARTKAFADLMTSMEGLCSAGHVRTSALELLLAVCKATHRHAEAGPFAPDFPPELIRTVKEYDIRHPERTVQALSNSSAQAHQTQSRAPTTYSAAAAQTGRTDSAVMALPAGTPVPFPHLKDKHIVGQGKGSAQRAAIQGGRQNDRLYARGAKKEDAFVLVNRLNADLASNNAPHFVRVDVISECPTGLAVSPKRPCTAHQLYKYKEVIEKTLGASRVEFDEQWERWVIHDVATHAGSGAIDDVFITEQLKQVFPEAIRGEAKRLCRQDEDWSAKTATPVAFYSSVHANFYPGMEVRILGRQFRLRRHQLRPSTVMCEVCGSYRHKTAACESGSRCVRCGKYGHSQNEHTAQCQKCLDANWATEEWNGRTNSAGRLLSNWMGAQGWVLGLEAGTPTRGSAALDLIFLSPALHRLGWLRECTVRPDLATGSDHEVIWTDLSVRRGPAELDTGLGRLSEGRTDVELMKAEFESLLPTFEALIASAASAAETGDEAAKDQLDIATEALNGALHKAVTTSTPRSSGRRGGYVWWNRECEEAHTQLRAARQQQKSAPRSNRYQERFSRTRGKFHKAVTKAKRAWAKQKVEDLEGNDIFGAMQWAKGRRRYRSPPLMDLDGGMKVETKDKAEALRKALLPPPAPADLPQIDLHLPHDKTVAEEPLAAPEVETALFEQDPNKAAGPDGVSFLTLRRLWPVAKDSIVTLLGTGLKLGWHPRVFRQATLVALKKAGNRDPAQPRSYRLVSLLPCLGKVLEKIVARRLSFYAQKYGWIPPEQFGGMPGRSTDDAALTLVHDVEAGWAKREQRTTSALAFDVKGAFDATHGRRLVHQLYQIGCPLHLVRWVEAFLKERSAAVRLDGETTEMSPLDTGIPQGSPVSPILFIIFVSPLLRLFGPQSPDPRLRSLRVIGFIDDGLIYTCSLDIQQNCDRLAHGYQAAQRWAEEVGLTFDPQKRELIHFPPPHARHPAGADPLPAVTLPDGEVAPVLAGDTVRWLGFHLDSKLSFKRHVEIMCAKARKAAACMRMLVSTVRGLRASDARRLYIACVLPIMTFGAAVWWQGRERVKRIRREEQQGGVRLPEQEEERVQVRGSVGKLQKMEREQSYALRMVIPVWRTTSIPALQVEAGCMPMEQYLDRILDRFAIRLAGKSQNHTLLRRAGAFGYSDSITPASRNRAIRPPTRLDQHLRRRWTRLTLLARRCDAEVERVEWLRPPWWEALGQNRAVEVTTAAKFPRSKSEAATMVRTEISRRRDEICVFSDGSRKDSGVTGAGWVIYFRGNEIGRGSTQTGSKREVFDAELIGMLDGLTGAIGQARARGIAGINIFVDNDAALQAVKSGSSTSSLKVVKSFDNRARRWLRKDAQNRLRLSWVPGHAKVDG